MKLIDLEKYPAITIQCHDNPDADTIASGYALYRYYKSKGIHVRLLYSGANTITKSNLLIFIQELHIPIEYLAPEYIERVSGVLLTVDCQYGCGNVTRIPADAVAVIDHHPQENLALENFTIESDLGSCATLVWRMLLEACFDVSRFSDISMALYYGLYSDTNQFSELFATMDLEMRNSLQYDKALLNRLRSSNISLAELEIAGVAMLRYYYDEDYRFGVIKAQPCDPNILGLISDFLLQVDAIDTCVVFNEINEGFKFSVRSSTAEVDASVLAQFLAEGVGTGGGKVDKAGGFISHRMYSQKTSFRNSESFFRERMRDFHMSR